MIYEVEDNRLNITDTSNTKGRFRSWFWNKSINRSDLDIKKDRNNNEDENKDKKN